MPGSAFWMRLTSTETSRFVSFSAPSTSVAILFHGSFARKNLVSSLSAAPTPVPAASSAGSRQRTIT